ncbi:MAG: hypothetical protein U1E81_08180 [Xanthobacteraceae bacterium]
MKNYLMRGTDELALSRLLDGYCCTVKESANGSDSRIAWNENVTPDVKVLLRDEIRHPALPYQPAITAGGFFVIVQTGSKDSELQHAFGQACLMAWDSVTGDVQWRAVNATADERKAHVDPLPLRSVQPAHGGTPHRTLKVIGRSKIEGPPQVMGGISRDGRQEGVASNSAPYFNPGCRMSGGI